MTRLSDSEQVVGYIPPASSCACGIRHVRPRYQAEPDEQITPVKVILLVLVALFMWVALGFLTMFAWAVS